MYGLPGEFMYHVTSNLAVKLADGIFLLSLAEAKGILSTHRDEFLRVSCWNPSITFFGIINSMLCANHPGLIHMSYPEFKYIIKI